jgi:hypothetical protein
MNDVKPCIVVSFLLVLFFFMGCDENPMTPESGTIYGVVDFSGTWPETGNISISLNTSWPEVTGAPYAFTTIYSDHIDHELRIFHRLAWTNPGHPVEPILFLSYN